MLQRQEKTLEKGKIKSILYIMGKFSISREAYRELTQLERTLLRSYLVEEEEAT